MSAVMKDITNSTINRITFLRIHSRSKWGVTKWVARCYCGKEFTCVPSKISGNLTKSCGCFRKQKNSEEWSKRIGPLHPNWNSEISDEDRMQDRDLGPRKLWARSVYKRDGFRCVVCGGSKSLNAHHLDGWHWCINKRYDVDNGVSLCVTCHKRFHKKYGNRYNTKEQFQEFQEKD